MADTQPVDIPVKRGVVAVARRGEFFLAIRRGELVAAPGRLCFPGGHIEPGETEHEAVVRECREELAAMVQPRECVWRSVTSWGTSLAWWTVQVSGESELVPHPIEVAEILWLSAEEMIREPTLLDTCHIFSFVRWQCLENHIQNRGQRQFGLLIAQGGPSIWQG